MIDDPKLIKNDDLRKSYIKRHALNSIIYDEAGDAQSELPFIHKKEDKMYQKTYELKYLKKTIMGDYFNDIEDLGIEFNKDEDFEKKRNAQAE